MMSRLPSSPLILLAALIAAGPVAAQEQTAHALRLQSEVAAEAACVSPEMADTIPAEAATLSRAEYLDYCACFARVAARQRPPLDQAELIETRGVPPEPITARAHNACMPAPL